MFVPCFRQGGISSSDKMRLKIFSIHLCIVGPPCLTCSAVKPSGPAALPDFSFLIPAAITSMVKLSCRMTFLLLREFRRRELITSLLSSGFLSEVEREAK